MSQYLIDRIRALPNVELHTETELTRLVGDPAEGLQEVGWRKSGEAEERHPIGHVFLFIGAVPNTDWLRQCAVKLDSRGFVRTGEVAGHHAGADKGVTSAAVSLETSLQGVFAAGDVRAGSVKRVSAAVGDGAAVAAQLHLYLQAIWPADTISRWK